MQRFDDVVKSELALTAWRHGQTYGGHSAGLMVAHCLRNRQQKGWNNWLGVIESIPKFSATLDQPAGMPTQWDRNFLKILSAIDGIFDNTTKDIVNGGLYWADLRKIESGWFLEKIARSTDHHRVADMNTLVFWD